MDELRKEYIRELGYSIEKVWDCSSWDHFKNNIDVKNHGRTQFPFKRHLSFISLLQNISIETMFGCAIHYKFFDKFRDVNIFKNSKWSQTPSTWLC